MKTILATSSGMLLGLFHSWFLLSAAVSSEPMPDWVGRLGWTLVHSLWQLTVVGLIAALVESLLARCSPKVRYIVGVLLLMAMVVLPCATWNLLDLSSPGKRIVAGSGGGASGQPQIEPVIGILPLDQPVEIKSTMASHDQAAVVANDQELKPESAAGSIPEVIPHSFDPNETNTVGKGTENRSVEPSETLQSTVWEQRYQRACLVVEPYLPWLVWPWLAGVVICSLRPFCGLWIQWRLRRIGLSPVSEATQQSLRQLTRRMGMTRAVRLAESALVTVPLVVGYLRPMILLPASILTGLTPAQLDSLLAHELAHVQRHDWLVNAMQVVVETLFFFHPAVWWLSNRIRHERELCCDDIALAVVGDRATYARMLLTVEELRHANSAMGIRVPSSIAATGGDLIQRIRRLMPAGSDPERTSRGWLSGAILLLTLGIFSGFSAFAVPKEDAAASAQSERPEAIEETPKKAEPQDVPKEAPKGDMKTNVASEKPAVPADAARKQEKADAKNRRSVRVIDEDNKPVVGATVRFQFVGTKGNYTIYPGYSMLTGLATTDESGEYSEEIPDGANEVYVTVAAKDFGEFNDSLPASKGTTVVELKKGRVIRVRAVDSNRNLLKQAVPLLSGNRVFGREFVPQPDGTFKSPTVALTRRMMRVCAAQENGPTLFSELVDVATAKPGDDGVLELVLTPGVRLKGRLADAVPRPISEGYVQLYIVDGPGHTFDNDSFQWEESTPVQPDGTFTFDSIPGGGHAQFHVVVDGYMSVNPTAESIIDYVTAHQAASEKMLEQYRENLSMRSQSMWVQLVPLDRPEVEVTVECEKTASCDFLIVDAAGNPIPNARVSFSPNGVTLSASLFIPGTQTYSPSELVEKLGRGGAAVNIFGDEDKSPRAARRKQERAWGEKSFLGAKSNEKGLVQIRNLPGHGRESFRVTADGYVLPRSPVYQRDGDQRDDDRREGYVDLVMGETNEATITLERDLKVVNREILVIDNKGQPQPKVSVAVAEIRVGKKDWQLWSTQRFGALPREITDEGGRVVLQVPSVVNGHRVEQLRLALNYWSGRDDGRIWVNGAIVEAPLVADKGVIALIPNPDESRPGSAKYGKMEDVLPKLSTEELLTAMIKQPSLAILRQLLVAAPTKQPEPIELLDEGRFQGGDKKEKVFRVSIVPAGDEKLAVVKARVRPADGTRDNVLDLSYLPECAFVFEMDGKLIATLGGQVGTTGSGSPENIEVLSLGPQEDWFVRVKRFQKYGQFEYQTEYYRLANPVVKSLKYYHYANSNGWSHGPEKLTRWGTLYFDFPKVQDKFDSPAHAEDGGPAQTADGVPVLRTLTWDGDRNLFVGAAAQFGKGKPLYEVDLNFSDEFEAINLKQEQLFVKGGAREYDHWNSWQTVVPKDHTLLLTITLPQADGESKVVEKRLGSGKRHVQLQLKPNSDNKSTHLRLRLDSLEPESMDLPMQLGDQPGQQPPITRILNAGETARLLDHAVESSTKRATVEIQLVSDALTEKELPKE